MDINKNIKKVLFSEADINTRCIELAKELDKDYEDKMPIMLPLLKGSVPFVTMLTKHMKISLEFDYMKASSYHGGTVSSGNVAVTLMPSTKLENRHVIIVEDIVDTGTTLSTITKIINDLHPASLEIVTLLDKPSMRKVNDIIPKYVGFIVPNEFVVGFGLDYKEDYRHLPYVGVLKEEIYK